MSDMITTEDDETGRVQAIIKRAEAGDVSVLPELRVFLDDNPALWRQMGNLATHAELVWVELIAGTSQVAAESLRRFIATMKCDLIGPSPSPALRLQADQVAISWLQLHHADIQLASLNQKALVPLRQLESETRRQQQLARGHQRALAMLETLRRLEPVLQAPDGGGTPITGETGGPELEMGILPLPTIELPPIDTSRRIVAQTPAESPVEPMRRAQ